MRRPAVRSAMKDSDRIGFCVPGPSGVHILAARPSYFLPPPPGSTRAPVLRRGGRTARGLAPGVGRVKFAGVMQIHRPLPFFLLFYKALSVQRSERRIRQVVRAL